MDIGTAIQIAAGAHKDQTDLSGNCYTLHPMRVMLAIENSDIAEPIDDLLVVAVLHDLVEDTDWSLFDLETCGATHEQTDAIEAITRKSGETYADFILRCVQNPLARIVKIYDIKDNLRPRRGEKLNRDHRLDLRRRYYRALEILDPKDEFVDSV